MRTKTVLKRAKGLHLSLPALSELNALMKGMSDESTLENGENHTAWLAAIAQVRARPKQREMRKYGFWSGT